MSKEEVLFILSFTLLPVSSENYINVNSKYELIKYLFADGI